MRLRDFLLVEFARAWQEEQGAARVDPEVAAALRAGPELVAADGDARLVLYARALLARHLGSDDGVAAPGRIHAAVLALGGLAPALGLLTGAAMVRVSLPAPSAGPVSLFELLAAAVLIPALFLVWTMTATALSPRLAGRGHSLAWLVDLARERALGTDMGRLAVRVLRRGGLATSLLASWSHTLWITAIGSLLLTAAWRFAFVDHVFAWSSTLPFTGEQVHGLFSVLAGPFAAWPALAPPTLEQVQISEFGSLTLRGGVGGGYVLGTGDALRDLALRKAWYGPMLGVIALWGLAPRIAALAWARHAGRRAIRAALADPATASVLAALSPPPEITGAEPRSAAGTRAPIPQGAATASRVGRGLQVVRFAAEAPTASELDASGLDRLGLAPQPLVIARDDDDDGMDAAHELLAADAGPEGAVVVFELASIPDRLKEEFLGGVVRALPDGAPIHVLLVGTARFVTDPLGERALARRLAWVALAERTGLPPQRVHGGEGPRA